MRLSILLERLSLQLEGNILFIFVCLSAKSILLLSHFMLCLYTIMPFFMAAFLSIENGMKKQ